MNNNLKGRQGDLFKGCGIPKRRGLDWHSFRTKPEEEIMRLRPWNGKSLKETISAIASEYEHDECFPYREAVRAAASRARELCDFDFRAALNVQSPFEKLAAIDICSRLGERPDALAYIKLQLILGPQANAAKGLVYAFFHSSEWPRRIGEAARDIKARTGNAPRQRFDLLLDEAKKLFMEFLSTSKKGAARFRNLFDSAMELAHKDFSREFNRLVEFNKHWLYDSPRDSEHVRELED